MIKTEMMKFFVSKIKQIRISSSFVLLISKIDWFV